MTEQTPPSVSAAAPDLPPPRKRRRARWILLALALLVLVCAASLAWWMHSENFAQLVREHLKAALANATGARVEIGAFRWSVTNLEADADNIVLHGNEPAGEAPYARIQHLHASISVLGFFSPRILLRALIIDHPQVHIIVYPDQTTNQPHPRTPSTSRSGLDTFFNLQAGHIAVEQGTLDYDSRADSIDFQKRYLPLDFEANDASLILQYAPANGKTPESYHIDAGVADLNLTRGKQHTPAQVGSSQIQGLMQASIDLTRKAAYLRSMRITAHSRGMKDRTLEISGEVDDFTHPRWQARLSGEFDLHLLNPALGYPNAPEGIAHLNLTAASQRGLFRIDGPVQVEHGSYIDIGVTARDINLTTLIHADNEQLHMAQVVVRPAQGGEIDGDVLLNHWLPVNPAMDTVEPSRVRPKHSDTFSRFGKKHAAPPAPPPPPPASHDVLVKAPLSLNPVDGKVTAAFKSVALDTVMDLVGRGAFQRLGVGTVFSGPAEATWSRGDVNTLNVHAALSARTPIQTPNGEVPANGTLEATYTQRNGSVEVKALDLTMPATHLEVHGHVGASPITSPTSISINCQSHDLSEFDSLLRDLGLRHEGKTGAAALPVALHGEGDFQVQWTGSLASPRIAGNLKATQIGIEIPADSDDASSQPRWISWDELDAEGSYDAERISILHGHLRRGTSEVAVDGTITAAAPSENPVEATQHGRRQRGQVGVSEQPGFNSASVLHAHVRAEKVLLADLLPITELDLPITGTLDAQIEADGPLSSPSGSGWAQITDAVAYNEHISHARAQGTLANHVLHLSSLTVQSPAGTVNASGSYDIHARGLDAEAHGSNLDLSQVEHLRSLSDTVMGRLTFAVTASGAPDDPRINGHAEATNLMLQGRALGAAQLTAHTVNGALAYELTSHSETADLHLTAQTELRGDFATQAQVEFSRFNIGSALKLEQIEGFSADSELNGTATVSGPLRYPERMKGDLQLNQAAFTVAGVHLASQGALHATLADARVHLDPLHIVGDQTDLHAEGSLDLRGDHKLDLTANGSVNLKLAETLDKDLTANGATSFQVEAHGPVANPQFRGSIDFQDGSLSLEDLPNGLSHIHGTLEFNQNRLEVRSLTAMTGGGQLSLGGYLAYQHGIYADLSVSGKNIRIRYPDGVSSLADLGLRLQGSQKNLALTGNVLITRFSISPDLDIAALAAQANAPPPIVSPDAPSNHVRLDVRIQSSPQLNFQNAYAKLAGDADLRLRGTLASPSLLGSISITEGSATIAGTRYTLQRGEVTFSNPVRIQPLLDLNATARVEDYDITLGLHGTPDKLSVTYRSDPPLPESDVVALLAVGRTQSEQGIYTQQQQSASSSTDVLLGGALNATMSSRVQKLFGAGSVKVDPSYLGALGNSTTRITVEEQLGRYVTLTYATNVDTSAQQLLQAEIAINRHVSLQVQRDESGVFSMVLKNTRRYK